VNCNQPAAGFAFEPDSYAALPVRALVVHREDYDRVCSDVEGLVRSCRDGSAGRPPSRTLR
jgi:hypothetical protein